MINAYYHSNCYDGYGAYWALRTYLQLNNLKAEYYPVTYGNKIEVPKNSLCIFSDFCPDSEEVLKEFSDNNLVIILDHHKTAEDKLLNKPKLDFSFNTVLDKYNKGEKGLYCLFDMNQSGAGITYRYMFNNSDVPNMIKLIEDRDLWKFAYSESKYFHAYLTSKPFDYDTYNNILNDSSTREGLLKIIESGKSLVEYSDSLVSKICEPIIIKEVNGKRVGIVNVTSHWAEAGEYSVNKYKLDYYVSLTLNFKDNLIKGSVRRPNGLSTIPLAERFKGGGHKGASGFALPMSYGIEKLMEEIFEFVANEGNNG